MIESRIDRVMEQSVGGSRVAQEMRLRRRMQELTESSLGFPRGAIVVSRRVVCGETWPDLRAQGHRPALGPVPMQANVVWFLDEAEYIACLLGGAARKQLDGWWWRLALGALPTPVVVARVVRDRGPVVRVAIARALKAGLGPALAQWMGSVELPGFPLRETVPSHSGADSVSERNIAVRRQSRAADSRPTVTAGVDEFPDSIPGEPGEMDLPEDAHRMEDASIPGMDRPQDVATEDHERIASPATAEVGSSGKTRPPIPTPALEAAFEAPGSQAPAVRNPPVAKVVRKDFRRVGVGEDSPPDEGSGKAAAVGGEIGRVSGRDQTEFAIEELPKATECDLPLASRHPLAFSTEFGGILFVLNALISSGWFGDFTRPLEVGIVPTPWIALGMLGRRWFGRRFLEDRIWQWLEEHRDGSDFPETSMERETLLLEARIASTFGKNHSRAAALLCHRRAVVLDDGNRLVARFALEQHPLAIRMAGWDRDPGWMESGGRDVRFEFSVAGER